MECYISLFSCVLKISLFYPHLQLTFQVISGCWFMLLNHVLYEHLWSAGASLLFNVQWAVMGKRGHFCCLLALFFPFYPGGNYLLLCYPVSITLHSTCASSHSQSLHSPICSQCHCICPCRHYLVLIFCWLLNHYWAASLQIMAYRMPIYQKYFTMYSWSHQSGIYVHINSLWSYVLFPTFFIKNHHTQREMFFLTYIA